MASETMTLADAIQVCERIMPTISAYAQDIRAVAAMQTLIAHARATTAGTGAGGGRVTVSDAMVDEAVKTFYVVRDEYESAETAMRAALTAALAASARGAGAGGGRMTEAMTDQQIIAGIQAAFSLNVLRACWTNADYLDEFKRAALAASARGA